MPGLKDTDGLALGEGLIIQPGLGGHGLDIFNFQVAIIAGAAAIAATVSFQKMAVREATVSAAAIILQTTKRMFNTATSAGASNMIAGATVV